MDERLHIDAKRFQEIHRMQSNRGVVRWLAAPSPAGQSWQMSLKRSLSERRSLHPNRSFAAIPEALRMEPALMVNNSFPKQPSIGRKEMPAAGSPARLRT
jgi:hypothetical protein